LQALATRGEPLAWQDDIGSWLLFGITPAVEGDQPAVLWLLGSDSRQWTESDMAGLALAGDVLWQTGRLTTPEPPEQVSKRLGDATQVASRLSHDFGNLLTGILGFTELALSQAAAGTLVHQYLGEVWDVARDGAEWLKKLNYFCRRSSVEYTPAGLPGALAAEAARVGTAEAATWQVHVPADLPALGCDAESLCEALRQVVENAREATGGKGTIAIAARVSKLSDAESRELIGGPAPGRFVEITIADQGPGLNPEARRRLFKELFFSSKPRHRGLGLMMTYGILRRFGGGLRLGPGAAGGTRVRLYFPAAPDPVSTGPARILVVDDDTQVLTEARRILEAAGYSVAVAMSAVEALALHQSARDWFDLLLLAVHLPSSSGPELARRIMLRDPQANCLFLHTPAGPGLPRDELLTPGNLVHKPFTAPVLLQTVAAALRRGARATAVN
jgi:signal transduction histidine kinase